MIPLLEHLEQWGNPGFLKGHFAQSEFVRYIQFVVGIVS